MNLIRAVSGEWFLKLVGVEESPGDEWKGNIVSAVSEFSPFLLPVMISSSIPNLRERKNKSTYRAINESQYIVGAS